MQCFPMAVMTGSLTGQIAVRLRFRFVGMGRAGAGMLPLQRLLVLHRYRRLGKMLYPRDPGIGRRIVLLQAHDELSDGASLRELSCALVGAAIVEEDWNDPSDSLRSRIRRLARQARAMAVGGYKDLLRK